MNMKTKVLLIVCTLCAVGSFAEPRGWGVGLGVFDGDGGVQARKGFEFGETRRYAIDLQAGLYNQNKWTGRFNADFHYIFRPDSAFRLYPLAGINFAIQGNNNRAGANIGGGALVDLNTDTRLFFEAKYVAGDWDGYALTAGIYF